MKIARGSLQSPAPTAGSCAVIDWRFGVFIQLDADTSHGPDQIGILSQSRTGSYTVARYPATDTPAAGGADEWRGPPNALGSSDPVDQ